MAYPDTGLIWRIADIASGAPCLDRTGILVEVIASRFAAGESIFSLAADYGVTSRDIEAAVRLVVASTFSNRCRLPVRIERAMESKIPLLPARKFHAEPSK